MQGWFPYDKELWGPNVLEQSLASGDMVCPSLSKLYIIDDLQPDKTRTCL